MGPGCGSLARGGGKPPGQTEKIDYYEGTPQPDDFNSLTSGAHRMELRDQVQEKARAWRPWTTDLLATWHYYRAWALLALVVAVFALRTLRGWRERGRERLSFSPPPPFASDKSASGPLPKDLDPPPGRDDDDHVDDLAVVEAPEKRPAKGPRRITGARAWKTRPARRSDGDAARTVQPLVFFFSLGGSTRKAAEQVAASIREWAQALAPGDSRRLLEPQLHDLAYIDYDDFFTKPPNGDGHVDHFYLILLPTYDIDTVLHNFLEHLRDTHHDFRIDTGPLSSLSGYSVFGFGDRDGWPTEDEGFCSAAKEVDMWMARLTGRRRAFPVGMGDVKTDADERLDEWRLGVLESIRGVLDGRGLGDGVAGSGDAVQSDEESADESDRLDGRPALKKRRAPSKRKAAVDDLEDLGRMVNRQSSKGAEVDSASTPLAVDFTTYNKASAPEPAALKEMVPKASPTYNALTKQGYTIVGSHSGVKICRWTKSALRGRGSCYKFSFYGIQSHLCMETTPSLSCSNKCVFCWRHGTNPVGTSWRWQVDPPEAIFRGVKEGHYQKIRMLKGVPGVRAERFAEAMRIRHCALSLVGEPIFYPHINALVDLLHAERISTFVVCNAQHPDQLAALGPVTQLYVSIDASNSADLRRIDRPLHRDFWDRFTRCLDIIRAKRARQRTVFRLTLVKGFNLDAEARAYADLVERGLPCFVEVKGVTYCGTSTSAAAGLTMRNVPFYGEVCAFVAALVAELQRRGLGYGVAAEHAHSCCVLVASDRFRIRGVWRSLIDYGRFFDCLDAGAPFGPEDYVGGPTPEWALWGNGGFDPRDERVDRKGRRKVVEGPVRVPVEVRSGDVGGGGGGGGGGGVG